MSANRMTWYSTIHPARAATLLLTLAVVLVPTSIVSAAETLRIGGTGAALATMRLVGAAFEKAHSGIRVVVPASLGSGGGIKAVLKGKIDIGVASRLLKEEERSAGAIDKVYARSPFVLVASGLSDIDLALSTPEVEDIFAFRKTTWSDGQAVRLILRPESDSDTAMLLKWFPTIRGSLEKARKTRGIATAISDQEAMNLAERVTGTVTTATLTAVVAEKRNLKPLIIDGVEPVMENLHNGTYKWYKELRYVTTEPQSETVKAFLSFLTSAEGARLLREAGNVPATGGS